MWKYFRLCSRHLLFAFQFIVNPEGSEKFDANEAIVNEMLGFTRIINEVVKSKKPIVGHNCFSDLVRIHQQFLDDLPTSYEAFKNVIHEAFPEVYDTKHLAFYARRHLEDREKFPELAGCLCTLPPFFPK